MPQTILITATREPNEESFHKNTFLGISLLGFPSKLRPTMKPTVNNRHPMAKGLSKIYNEAIDAYCNDDTLVFVHDDVYIHDWFLSVRVSQALETFDLIGVAGSANPDLKQPSWGLRFDANLFPQGWQENLDKSGAVNHVDPCHPRFEIFGETPKECRLLDGCFLAVRASKIRSAGVRFAEQFKLHCYDIDFCRSAKKAHLKLGTWPIAVTHRSAGDFRSEDFRNAARAYLDKWK